MENTLPQNPQPNSTSETQLAPSTSSNTLKMAVVGLMILLPVVAVSGYYLGKSASKNNSSSDNPIVMASPSAEQGVACTMDAKVCPDGSSVGRSGPNCEFAACPSETENGNKQYSHESFKFSYPSNWTLSDTQTNKVFFDQNNLDGFDHGVLLEKKGEMLFIGIDQGSSGAEVGGIFTSDQEFTEYLKFRDEVTIQGKKYYLFKNATPFSALTDQNRSAGIFGAASLAEYIPNKVNNQGKVFNGYNDYIMDKNGRSYLFAKFSKNGASDQPTNVEIQQELIEILKSISW
ncbi:MAG TPA: hypothetical protein VF209_01365 [Patescibacteria group bacterium]